MKLLANFYSPMKNASGMLLKTDIYFNDTIDSIIDKLQAYKLTYPEYDYLQLENNSAEGYCLVGYIKGRLPYV